MKAIELIGNIDEQHRLHAQVPAEIPAGQVRLIVFLPGEDEAGRLWADGIASEWSAELSDPREDIYTLEDGQPVDSTREIYLARFPFGDVPGMKLRPVLLLTGTVGPVPEVLVAYISSVLPATLTVRPHSRSHSTVVSDDESQSAFRTAAAQARDDSLVEFGSPPWRAGNR